MSSEKQRRTLDFDYLESLRKNVINAVHFFRPNEPFKANKSRGSDGYKMLQLLVKTYTAKTISFSAMVEFFHKRPVYNPKLKRKICQFEVYTIEGFESLVSAFESEKNNTSLNESIEHDIKQILRQLYVHSKYNCEVQNYFTIDEDGNCASKCEFFIKAQSDIAVQQILAHSDEAITVVSAKAYDSTTKQILNIYPQEVSTTSYLAYILFPQLISAKSVFRYTYEIEVQRWLVGLVQNGYLNVERLVVPGRYKSIIEHYQFPDTDFFKFATMSTLSHTDKKMEGKYIKPIYRDGLKVFTVDYGKLGEIDSLIRFKIDLRRP